MITADWTPLADHLWQSTAVACAAALLALSLRNNHARIRYCLWLIASIKFLVPFSALVAVGRFLSGPAPTPLRAPAVTAVIQQVTQPFSGIGATAAVPHVTSHALGILPILVTVWLAGVLAVVMHWCKQWMRIRRAMRVGSRLAVDVRVPVILTPALLEPGIFGIFRPVLLLPDGIADRLTQEHLEAILAHELCHVRRRDNLAAAIHMSVEAIFWFYPLVWWIGSRLVDERERACDEEVLRGGNAPAVYAESILKTYQFYIESPLACLSGITGSDLKKRIVRIMTQRLAERLTLARKALLGCVAAAVIAGPVLFGLSKQEAAFAQSVDQGPLPSFEAASVKPNRSGGGMIRLNNTPGRFSATNVTPKLLIEYAYNIKDPQLSGGPAWIATDHYDIEATTNESPEERKANPSGGDERRKLMLRSLLAERFKLTLNQETRELPVYDLVVAKGGPKFHETVVPPIDPNAPPPAPSGPPPGPGQPFRGRGMRVGPGQLTMNGGTMAMFADHLSQRLGRSVIDKTGLKGEYDLSLQWTPEQNEMMRSVFGGAPEGPGGKEPVPPPDSGPTIFTALQEQLGLKLESAKGPVTIYVIAHIEQPSPN
jgi:uncharacterized protein (TIGR03435 family)